MSGAVSGRALSVACLMLGTPVKASDETNAVNIPIDREAGGPTMMQRRRAARVNLVDSIPILFSGLLDLRFVL